MMFRGMPRESSQVQIRSNQVDGACSSCHGVISIQAGVSMGEVLVTRRGAGEETARRARHEACRGLIISPSIDVHADDVTAILYASEVFGASES